ncbi:MAG TPA: TonB-dependent receptor, partial [Bryobacteraceae bacterium]|nr:TonB-dependent receptor [Bryobacteraceae bacterium]
TFSSSQGMRFYMTEIQLIPGAFAPGTGFTSGARINGAPNGTQRTTIDGMDGTNQINAVQAGTGVSVDAMQETAIQTSNFAAEFGQVGGGLFNITMRSGTNQYHGGGFDYLANEAFNGSTPFSNVKPRIRRNNYGYSLGGPVWIPKVYNGKDKTFFFYNKEQFREFFAVNDTAITVPTAAYRGGNFAQALNASRNLGTDPLGNTIIDGMVYDPQTKATVGGVPVRTQFVGNVIPLARFDKVSSAVQALIPNPSDPSRLTGNLLPNFPTDRVTTNESVKIDHQLSSKAKISGTWTTNGSGAQYSTSLNLSEGLPATITQTRGTFSRSMNWRLNFDYTISPTMLWHVGVGSLQYLLDDHSPTTNFDQSSIGLFGPPNPGKRFPTLTGLTSTSNGGMVPMGPGVGAAQSLTKQFTPTYGTTLTWVNGNHTYKFGGELRTFGYPLHSLTATNGNFAFSSNQTSQLSNCATATTCAAVQSSTLGAGTMGFPYASFLLGLVNTATVNPPVDLKTGKRFLGFYAQDSWKVTRKLTLDYGMRYDYDTYPREQYGRMPTLAAKVANPTVGGYPGATIYEQTCNCKFAKNYPWAFAPRLGVAYQITPKTVFRAGFGVTYDGTATAATGTGVAGVSNAFTWSVFGDAAMQLQTGVPSANLVGWPNLSPGVYPSSTVPGSGPASVVDQNAGRPPRQIQWSIGLQREITRNTVVEASYVANRGVWWPSTILNNYNAISDQALKAAGLDINSAADRTILTSQITAPGAGRFQNKLPYAGFSGSVAQSLRPFPQFVSGLSPLWAPQGKTWYDSLQAKVTQRVWHGLEAQYVFTWAKELQQGVEGGTVNDVFNRSTTKSLSGFSRPLVSTLSINYRVPATPGNKIVSHVLRDWAVGATLSYASGLPILSPTSTNNLGTLNGGRNTYFNRVEGVNPFLKDLNCHCIDPTKDLVLNKDAWANPAPGQWGTASPYYNDYRYQRRPAESVTLGRIFQFGTDTHPMKLTFRMNFTNILNRTQMQNPTATTPLAATVTSSAGLLTSGYGFVNYQGGSTFLPPRQGTLEMRFSF